MVYLNNSQMNHKPTWCPGCGNFGIWQALKNALVELKIEPKSTVLVYGIGCHGNMFNWLPWTSFEGLHGRALPVAQGIKMVNPELTVLAIAGDGDCYGEGGNHLLHAARRNMDITLLVHNNQVYGLTTGQTSPTSNKGFKTKSTPAGTVELAINPLSISLAAGASFVARGFAGDIPYLTDLIVKAIKHRGFSVVDILQPCITFNQVNTFDWFRKRVYKLEEFKTDDKLNALNKALEWPKDGLDGKIPIGIFYEEERETLRPLETENQELRTNFDNLVKEFL